MFFRIASLTDYLEHLWEEDFMKRYAGIILVLAYISGIIVIEMNRQGWLPPPLDTLPRSHFFAVEIAFTLLLITEVVSLVFGITHSFSRSIGIQMEILSLILLRDTFKKFAEFPEPLEWEAVSSSISTMAVEALGALAIFIIVQLFYKAQRGYNLINDEEDQQVFIAYKKWIALGLLLIFSGIGLLDIYRALTGREIFPFFETFYTVLIFTDVLLVLLSLRYSSTYLVTFRNFGYALVTVFVRLALIAPAGINAGIGIGASLFALAVAYSYNVYARDLAMENAPIEKQSRVILPQAGE